MSDTETANDATSSAPACSHTPGPWRLDRYANTRAPNSGTVVANNPHGEGAEIVANVMHWHGQYSEECPENAKLIAAAPSMKEALRKFVAWHDADHETMSPSEVQAMYDAAIDAAKAAIPDVV